MKEPFKIEFSHPTVKKIVQSAFPGAKTRRPVKIECRSTYHVSDYWDGGSRNECRFLKLDTMEVLSSASIPRAARQEMSNPFNLPICDVFITPGTAVVESIIFQGKHLGYRLYLNAEDIPTQLPEASSLIPLPAVEGHKELTE